MSPRRGWRRVLRTPRPVGRQAREDVDAEIAFHLDARTAELIAGGESPRDARRRAEREFGDLRAARAALEPGARRRVRRLRISLLLGEVLGDLHYGIRGLRANPSFAAVTILTLGLAIAANSSLFSVVDAVLLRPLPFRSPEQLTMLWTGQPGEAERGRADYLTAEAWREASATFEDMAVLDPVTVTLSGAEGAERIGVARISPNFLPLLGVRPIRGRLFTEAEASRRASVALISHDFWQTRFDGSDDVLGTLIRLDLRPSQIIGILPPGFDIPGLSGDVWEPHTLFPDWQETENEGTWFVVGRLRPDVTVSRAQAEMSGIARRLDEDLPAAERDRGIAVVPLARHIVGSSRRLALWVLSGAALCVLLIAAANVVSLSLARGVGRAGEFAVRATLGASPGRIVRQLLTESLTLATLSGVLGTLLAGPAIGLIRALGPDDLPRLNEAGLDAGVLAATLVLTLLIGVLIGLVPALTVMRRDAAVALAEGGRRGSVGVATRRIRRGLVVGEFAVAIILMAGAGLLIRSWMSLTGVDPGYRPERVLSINLSTTAYSDDARRVAFYSDVLDRVGALPGVESAGLIGDLLTDGDIELVLTGDANVGDAFERISLRVDEVSEDLFVTLGTPLLGGRFFSAEDAAEAAPVAIINEALAARLFPGDDPVGRRFHAGTPESGAPWITVVGLVGDMRRRGLELEPIPQIFVPLAQQPSGSTTLLVRTSTDDPLDAARAVETAVRDLDPRVPLYRANTLARQLGENLTQRRFQTSLLIAFSIVALMMAAIGIYGLIHHSVATRAREFAIRMAVGARAGDIFGLTISHGLRLSAVGLALGLAGALIAARAGSALLFGVSPADPLTYVVVSLLLVTVAAAACYFPARRSMRVDPVGALRRD